MKLSGVIHDTTGYIFNRGIKFLTVSLWLLRMFSRQIYIE